MPYPRDYRERMIGSLHGVPYSGSSDSPVLTSTYGLGAPLPLVQQVYFTSTIFLVAVKSPA